MSSRIQDVRYLHTWGDRSKARLRGSPAGVPTGFLAHTSHISGARYWIVVDLLRSASRACISAMLRPQEIRYKSDEQLKGVSDYESTRTFVPASSRRLLSNQNRRVCIEKERTGVCSRPARNFRLRSPFFECRWSAQVPLGLGVSEEDLESACVPPPANESSLTRQSRVHLECREALPPQCPKRSSRSRFPSTCFVTSCSSCR